MLSPFVCGNFSNQEENDLEELLSPCSTPKKSRKSNKDSKNPYADRGLDTFSALLDELDRKKQKIYTQKGSEDISLVRFVYSGSNNWRPIVVKSKDRKPEIGTTTTNVVKQSNNVQNSEATAQESVNSESEKEELQSQFAEKRSVSFWGVIDGLMRNLRNPYYQLTFVMILVLLLVILYGRSFAILCTSLGWYLVPMIKERSSTSTSDKPKNKKDITRRLSEKNMVNPTSVVVNVVASSDKSKNKKDYTRRLSEKNMGTNRSSSPKSPRQSSSPKSVLTAHSHKKSW
ncbi:OLC1v1016874C1 [Oldenlandia corymbosa var. corymbosa]|uniref:OLC1v1016874C1 n=1 Tax=Oldenlandia corymbosa var. corymbosa TaxID=529605 RepID=A0AAV1E843_OLDCO|nr:OLC1v1016874C1 [Oldenlandia corymbosa var. corymbosa]